MVSRQQWQQLLLFRQRQQVPMQLQQEDHKQLLQVPSSQPWQQKLLLAMLQLQIQSSQHRKRSLLLQRCFKVLDQVKHIILSTSGLLRVKVGVQGVLEAGAGTTRGLLLLLLVVGVVVGVAGVVGGGKVLLGQQQQQQQQQQL
jgi:hypothetical protein